MVAMRSAVLTIPVVNSVEESGYVSTTSKMNSSRLLSEAVEERSASIERCCPLFRVVGVQDTRMCAEVIKVHDG